MDRFHRLTNHFIYILPFNVACRRTLQATICAAACKPLAVICCWCNCGGDNEQLLFVACVSKHNVDVVCCLVIGSFDMNVPLRNKITSRGVDLTRRRVDERVVVVDDDFNKSESFAHAPVELKPNVVVFESIRVASSAIITTLAFGSTSGVITEKEFVIEKNTFQWYVYNK